MVAGGVIEAEYDVPPDAWYFEAERQPIMPFAVLLEVALQSCGFLAAYVGSALTSPVDLAFRNLEGEAELLEAVPPGCGTLTTQVRAAASASSGGMIIQSYEFVVSGGGRDRLSRPNDVRLFLALALAQQVGIREAKPYERQPGTGAAGDFDYPRRRRSPTIDCG